MSEMKKLMEALEHINEEQIPEIDIYDWRYHENPVFKEYFEQDDDGEYERPDFVQREKMRRAILKKAMLRFSNDFSSWANSNWEQEDGPFHSSDSPSSDLHSAYKVIHDLSAYIRRLGSIRRLKGK